MFLFEQDSQNQTRRTFQKSKTLEDYAQARQQFNTLISKKKRDDFIRQKRKRIADKKDAKKDFNVSFLHYI